MTALPFLLCARQGAFTWRCKSSAAGGMREGVIQPQEEGTPQGSPLSPLLSNILLDELDKELERRGDRFCRYADDCNIYVRSKAAESG